MTAEAPSPPVALFVYARPEHTRRVLEGLRANGVPLLHVFADAARTEDKRAAVEEVRAMVRAIDWAEVRLVERGENLGLARSIIEGTTAVLREYESAIVLEDDCVPRSDFYAFFRRALAFYRDNPRVWCISGYTAPCIKVPIDYPWSALSSPRYSSWGWATWRDRWQHYSNDLNALKDSLRHQGIDLTQAGNDIAEYLADPRVLSGEADIWTLGWLLVQYLNHGRAILPVESVVENIGLDDSGVHCTPEMDSKYTPRFDPARGDWFAHPLPPAIDAVPPFVLSGLKAQFDRPAPGLRRRLARLLRRSAT